MDFLADIQWANLALSIFTLVFGIKWLCTKEGVEFTIRMVQRKGFISLLLAVLGVLSYVASGGEDWEKLSWFLVGVASIFTGSNVIGDHLIDKWPGKKQ